MRLWLAVVLPLHGAQHRAGHLRARRSLTTELRRPRDVHDRGGQHEPRVHHHLPRALALTLKCASWDAERAAQADAERDFLVRELAHAVGLGGRDRRASSASDRARSAVTRALRQGMARIDEHHPELGEHLGRAIRTGTYCAYLPDPRAPIAWR